MHILLAALGLLGAAAFWWYRVKVMREAANEAVDAIGRVRGSLRRSKLRKQSALSPLTAVDDPVIAAATLIAAIVSEDLPLTPQAEQGIRKVVGEIAADDRATDQALIYAKWAVSQIGDTAMTIDKLAPFLRDHLDLNERNDLLEMVGRALQPDLPRPPLLDQRMRRLRQKLGFEIH
jgi:uncharacterized tellurite resistance protein B-like protein